MVHVVKDHHESSSALEGGAAFLSCAPECRSSGTCDIAMDLPILHSNPEPAAGR